MATILKEINDHSRANLETSNKFLHKRTTFTITRASQAVGLTGCESLIDIHIFPSPKVVFLGHQVWRPQSISTKLLASPSTDRSKAYRKAFDMCGCTLYDSPTCGHSWISMSQPCGFLSDLINCPYRHTYQTLIAPPYTCPTCCGGFADAETIEMVQGPWGCNQLVRGRIGGSYAIPGQWGHAPVTTSRLAGPALISGKCAPLKRSHNDHRLSGPYSPLTPMVCNQMEMSRVFDNYNDGFMYNVDCYDGRRRKSSHHHKYRYSSKPSTNCTVM